MAQISGSESSIDAASNAPPALLIKTETGLPTSLAASVSTLFWFVTSNSTISIFESDLASSANRSMRRAPAITWKPLAANNFAVAAPIPLLAPVTTA